MPNNIYIAKQPIVNEKNEIFAYELLFRALDIDGKIKPLISDEVVATSKVLVNTLNQFGVSSLVGNKWAFVNISQDFLLDDMIFSIPKDLFVLEILEHTQINENVINRIKELKEKGYKIALDDFVFTEEYLQTFTPIFKYLDFIKLDIPFLDENVLESYFEKLKPYNLTILAEKVETKEVFELYKSLGCELFQGYFFAKPDIVIKETIDVKYKKIFHLINMINDENFEIKEIAKEFESEIELTIQLLRFMNSAYIGLKKDVKSIGHVVMLFGRRPLKQWLILIAASNGGSINEEIIKNPTLDLALTRARIMEELSKIIKSTKNESDKASFVGVLSLIDALLNIDIKSIFEEISVDDEIKDAILERSGNIGKLLELVEAIEKFDIILINSLAKEFNLSEKQIAEVLIKSYS